MKYVSWVLCVRLTGIGVPTAYNEHEQQHRDDGGKQHPANGGSNHSRIHILTRFSCNTAQSHVAGRFATTQQASRKFKICAVSPPSGY